MEEGGDRRGGASTTARGPASASQATANAPREPPRPASDRLVTGVLVGHGAAPYAFEPQGAGSYFLTVRTERGERTLWGQELERALSESRTQPKVGDAIGIRENGIDPVTVVTRERTADGREMTVKRLDTPRGHWIIERREFFDERAAAAEALRDPRASRREAIRNHPELAGAYWALDAAAKVAEERIRDPGSRERFLKLVRESLAYATERGEALPVARKRATEARPGQDVPSAPGRAR